MIRTLDAGAGGGGGGGWAPARGSATSISISGSMGRLLCEASAYDGREPDASHNFGSCRRTRARFRPERLPAEFQQRLGVGGEGGDGLGQAVRADLGAG